MEWRAEDAIVWMCDPVDGLYGTVARVDGTAEFLWGVQDSKRDFAAVAGGRTRELAAAKAEVTRVIDSR